MRAALALAACFLVLFVGGGARFAIGLTFRPMVDEFGWARGELGLAVGALHAGLCGRDLHRGPSGRPPEPARAPDRRHHHRRHRHRADEPGDRSRGTRLFSTASVFAIGNGIASLVIVGVIVMRIYPGRAGLANAVAISGMSVGQLLMIAVLAGLLAQIGWRSVFVWIGIAHLLLLPLLLALPGRSGDTAGRSAQACRWARPRARAQFWLLLAIYAICGLDDFFVTTHVAAFAQDRGLGFSRPAICSPSWG